MKTTSIKRCAWVGEDPLYIAYHDQEWGVPVFDDRKLFEFLVLEGAQAGLSWLTVLKKREAYRKAFSSFDPVQVARYNEGDVRRLLNNPEIIRNAAKIRAAIQNAKAFLKVQEEFGSFAAYSWGFLNNQPIQNRRKNVGAIPPRSRVSDLWSRDLKKRGFQFVGSTIVYAHMQGVGMVNDHTEDCFRYRPVCRLAKQCVQTAKKYALFETMLGTCGILWNGEWIQRVQLPEVSKGKTVRKLLGAASAIGTSRPPRRVRVVMQKIAAHLGGKPQNFNRIPLVLKHLPTFHQRVLQGARTLRTGETVTYGELARQIGSPKAARAVGQALASNPFPILVPCHRILAAGKKLGGFSAPGGTQTKTKLLAIEGVSLAP